MNRFEHRYLSGELEYRADIESNEFEVRGWASTPDIDSVGDVILPTAFTRTLPDFLERGTLVWQHDWREPIGKPVEARVLERGLWIRALLSDSARANDAKRLIQDGVIRELSIGFQYRDAEPLTRELLAELGIEVPAASKLGLLVRDLDLYEVSLVTRAANPAARLVRTRSDSDENELRTVHIIRVPNWARWR